MSKIKKPSFKLLFTEESIITLLGETSKTYLGYSIFDDQLLEVEKVKVVEVPKTISYLLSSEEYRVKLAMCLNHNSIPKAAKALNICERSMHRKLNQYFELEKRVKQTNKKQLILNKA